MSVAPIMQIAVCSDANYLRHALVMLRSLLAWHRSEELCVHLVVSPDVGDEALEPIDRDLRPLGLDVRVLRIPVETNASLPAHRLFGRGAWYRLLLPSMLPDIECALYLDCDLIVCASLRAVWDLELGRALVAAADNPLHPHLDRRWLRQLGPVPARDYFNSGVMLLDLAGLRREHWQERFLRCVRQAEVPMPYADQDVLNALLHERRARLPRRYNLQSSYFELLPFELGLSSAELRELIQSPAVVHFTATNKPWKPDSTHPGRELYRHHAEQRPGPPPALDLSNLGLLRWQYHRRGSQKLLLRLRRRLAAGLHRRYAALAAAWEGISGRGG
ncbi:MAG: glycosyltransferase family 8 protein [Stagnimonas sp.]|nr:glycosyltransferase family 8 protein [Stagnimonas sp.]